MRLAENLRLLGRTDDAIKLLELRLDVPQMKSGTLDPEMLDVMKELAFCYEEQNSYRQALVNEAYAVQSTSFGREHPATLRTTKILALVYDGMEGEARRAEALKLREEDLAILRRHRRPDDPDTLDTMNLLANSYLVADRFQEAHDLGVEARKEALKTLGRNHPIAINSVTIEAKSLFGLGRAPEALAILDEFLKDRNVALDNNPAALGHLIDARLQYFASVRDPVGCEATAKLWDKIPPTDPDSMYEAATHHAITAAVIGESDQSKEAAGKVEDNAKRAVDWLQKAIDVGYNNLSWLDSDPNLNFLREPVDFKKVLAGTLASTQNGKSAGK